MTKIKLQNKKCKYCGEPFTVLYRKSKVYCSISCSNKARLWKAESKRKIAISRKRNGCTMSPKGKLRMINANLLKRDSYETRLKKSLAQRGEKGNNWKGGKKSLKENLRNTSVYKDWRMSCFARDLFRCVKCKSGDKIECHHIISFAELLDIYNIKDIDTALRTDKLWDIKNGMTLCYRCHNKTKSNNRCRV
jgi:hypothetical protein